MNVGHESVKALTRDGAERLGDRLPLTRRQELSLALECSRPLAATWCQSK
jgi:hypothetical protein